MTNTQKKTTSLPIVMTIKEQNVPKDYRIIGRLKNGEVIALSVEFLLESLSDEGLREVE